MRRVIALFAAMLATGPVAYAAAAPRGQTVMLMVVRTTSGASDLNLNVTAYMPSSGAFIGDVDATVLRGKVISTISGALVSGKSDQDGVDAGPLHVRTCGPRNCQDAPDGVLGMTTDYRSDRSAGDFNAMFIVAHGSRVTYKLTGFGWRIVPMPLSYALRDTPDSAPISVSHAGLGAAVFGGASAPGSELGSVAVASPPCSIAAESVLSQGVGKVTLNGGRTNPTFTCPVTVPPISSYADKATRWSLEGTAAGDTDLARAALFVINLPRRLPATAR